MSNVLVFGGRDYSDFYTVTKTLNEIHKKNKIKLIIHGDACGADNLGKQWARVNGVHYASIPALWGFYNDSAGFKRNDAMLAVNIDLAVMFKGGSGTVDMYKRLTEKNIQIVDPCNFISDIAGYLNV
ncbi:hypothetical protein [Vibrio phage vB_VibM_83AMN]|nr:hypothetical protein [Vibrio phage vB_VibM_83AMN]